MTIKLGAALPLVDTGGDPGFVRDYACTAEALGYDGLSAPDHVLGANIATRPDWGNRNTSKDFFHDPFVLFGYLAACTTRIGFSSQVLILPQRQTALVAKQAASLDVLAAGRFRFGIGLGWNPVEYQALGENFHDRGRRFEEQVAVMRQLWSEPHVTVEGRYHVIDDAGLNPLPAARSIPLWFGGHDHRMVERIARLADGWIMLAHAPDQSALDAFASLRAQAEAAGRDPGAIGLEVWTSLGDGDDAKLRQDVRFWKQAGVTHITLNNCYARPPHRRMQGRDPAAHLKALAQYRSLVADLL